MKKIVVTTAMASFGVERVTEPVVEVGLACIMGIPAG
jgi:hypothetical protein